MRICMNLCWVKILLLCLCPFILWGEGKLSLVFSSKKTTVNWGFLSVGESIFSCEISLIGFIIQKGRPTLIWTILNGISNIYIVIMQNVCYIIIYKCLFNYNVTHIIEEKEIMDLRYKIDTIKLGERRRM